MNNDLSAAVIGRTLRVPRPDGAVGDGLVVARQLDAVLMSAGFKLSAELFDRFAGLAEGVAIDGAVGLLSVIRRMVGDHVEHNVYFRDFPRNVPDTVEFWTECLLEALQDPVVAARVQGGVLLTGTLNLLDLPRYGRYQHTYTEMLTAHDEFIVGAGDRITLLHLGLPLIDEASRLYLELAGAVTPLSEQDRQILELLAVECADRDQPTAIPVRENRAVINRVRLEHNSDLIVDTVTDVLRAACAYCEGDVSLVQTTRFTKMPRRVRRMLLAALDRLIVDSPAKLADVNKHSEQFKRLGERLHPHEYSQFARAAEVFMVARQEVRVPTLSGRVEQLLGSGDVLAATNQLTDAPGQLMRTLDRLVRSCRTAAEVHGVVEVAAANVSRASGRVLFSVREHFANRAAASGRDRLFVNQLGRGKVVSDARSPIDTAAIDYVNTLLDNEIRRRLPDMRRVLIEPDMLDVALPSSGKSIAGGFGVLPRGSRTPVDGDLLRLFVYWRERQECTDFDLSVLFLDESYSNPEWVSYTNLQIDGAVHSGDIVTAEEGASEFIDVDLNLIGAPIVIAQVHVYSGEGFDAVAESFCGFMVRSPEQLGRPFEPSTVRMKSDLRGAGRIALPVAFIRSPDCWRAVWLNLNVQGGMRFNRVEGSRATTAELVSAVVNREFLTVGYLLDLVADRRDIVDPSEIGDQPLTYIGMADPGGLPMGSRVITPRNLGDLIPD